MEPVSGNRGLPVFSASMCASCAAISSAKAASGFFGRPGTSDALSHKNCRSFAILSWSDTVAATPGVCVRSLFCSASATLARHVALPATAKGLEMELPAPGPTTRADRGSAQERASPCPPASANWVPLGLLIMEAKEEDSEDDNVVVPAAAVGKDRITEADCDGDDAPDGLFAGRPP